MLLGAMPRNAVATDSEGPPGSTILSEATVKTTTREYGADGNLVKETIVEQPEQWPMSLACNCAVGAAGQWYCPMHGFVNRSWTWQSGTTTTEPHITVSNGTIATAASCV